jgi:hypothetical protein
MTLSIPDGPPLLRGRPDDYSAVAVFLSWPEYLNWLKGLKTWHVVNGERIPLPPPWKPGQHWANIGKTREGKTNYVVLLLGATRKYVIALDPKGEDPTLTKSGWPRVTCLPTDRRHFPKDLRKKIEDPYYTGPIRMIVGLDSKTRESDDANRKLLQDTLEYARQSGGWSVYVDEHQVATDPRMFGLGPQVARMAVTAASAKTSILTSMQYIGWSEKAPVRQASLVSLWKNKSRDLMRKLAEELGRDWRELAAIVDELDRFDLVTFSDDVRAPIILTRPPEL